MKITLYREKKCRICHKVKVITEFHKSKRMKLGYRNECKECTETYRAKALVNQLKKLKEK